MQYLKIKPKIQPTLDQDFLPPVLVFNQYQEKASSSKHTMDAVIAIERNQGQRSFYQTKLLTDDISFDESCLYIERIIKTLLWIYGGYKIILGVPLKMGQVIKEVYKRNGKRHFDVDFMERVYEKPFEVEIVDPQSIVIKQEISKPIGRHLDGYRIGFDAGGSDRKVSAVVNGEAIYSEEVVWHPKTQADPSYHIEGIKDSIERAISKMPRVDAIGVSSAGIFIDNKAMIGSLFRKVPEDLFDSHIKHIFTDIAASLGDIPIEVANDGDVTALAGSMSLNQNNVLGIAMGTSLAAGYVDHLGNLTGWLNELAFVPVDLNPDAVMDEWSLDHGVGVSYFSQDAVIKLAPAADIHLDPKLSPAEKLVVVQNLVKDGHKGAKEIFETIGIYLGYAVAYFSYFYDIERVLILGRVTSGEGGSLMIKWANNVLEAEFPALKNKIQMTLPDEKSRRVGQSIAAASLPDLRRK